MAITGEREQPQAKYPRFEQKNGYISCKGNEVRPKIRTTPAYLPDYLLQLSIGALTNEKMPSMNGT